LGASLDGLPRTLAHGGSGQAYGLEYFPRFPTSEGALTGHRGTIGGEAMVGYGSGEDRLAMGVEGCLTLGRYATGWVAR